MKPLVSILIPAFNAEEYIVEAIKSALVKQLYSPVRWSETVSQMGAHGITQIVEVGPGKVLQGLVKRINKTISCVSFNTEDTLAKAKELTQKS